FGKPEFEAYSTEIATVLQEIDYHLKHLKSWAKPKKVKGSLLTFPSGNRIYHQPYGSVLIIGAWNYPIRLVLHPLVGAISAGNTVFLKPSELAPETSKTVAGLIKKYFAADYVTAVEGGAETARILLQLPPDYIFFTGSAKTGKLIMREAAEHLTPFTLELGGKSPAIVHQDADMETSARRIWWGKCMNSGQTCVAPDFVAVHKNAEPEFIRHSKAVLKSFCGNSATGAFPEVKIINDSHFQRLSALLSTADLILGGETNAEKRYIAPALVRADWNQRIMKEEVFGPILPMVVYDNLPELAGRLRDMPSPLALYLFTGSSDVRRDVIRNIPFGGGCINDTISHLGNPNLPFGGVGASGTGKYHGKYSFDTFSNEKSVLDKPVWVDPDFRYPPYTPAKLNLIKTFFS
ncbi:MAG: aldehyde dehydrogenase family protein, partial [Balneolaceae bacterium]